MGKGLENLGETTQLCFYLSPTGSQELLLGQGRLLGLVSFSHFEPFLLCHLFPGYCSPHLYPWARRTEVELLCVYMCSILTHRSEHTYTYLPAVPYIHIHTQAEMCRHTLRMGSSVQEVMKDHTLNLTPNQRPGTEAQGQAPELGDAE